MRRSLKAALSAVVVAAPMALVATQFGASAAAPGYHYKLPHNATTHIAGLQHFCGSNGITCAEPATTWGELAGYKAAVKKGARVLPYIGHDEPATLFYSHTPARGTTSPISSSCPRTRRRCPGTTAAAEPSASSCTRPSGSAW